MLDQLFKAQWPVCGGRVTEPGCHDAVESVYDSAFSVRSSCGGGELTLIDIMCLQLGDGETDSY